MPQDRRHNINRSAGDKQSDGKGSPELVRVSFHSGKLKQLAEHSLVVPDGTAYVSITTPEKELAAMHSLQCTQKLLMQGEVNGCPCFLGLNKEFTLKNRRPAKRHRIPDAETRV